MAVIVKKDNRLLTVQDTDKGFYLAQGYDVVELAKGTYKVVESATGGRTYTVKEYNDLKAELDNALAKLAELEGEQPFDRQEAIATLTERGVEFKGNASNDTLKELLEGSE